MGTTSSKTNPTFIYPNKKRRRETMHIRNGMPPIKEGNGIQADGRSVYSDKPNRRTYNMPPNNRIFIINNK
jgi:hypothetical protein